MILKITEKMTYRPILQKFCRHYRRLRGKTFDIYEAVISKQPIYEISDIVVSPLDVKSVLSKRLTEIENEWGHGHEWFKDQFRAHFERIWIANGSWVFKTNSNFVPYVIFDEESFEVID